jgi:7-cyano-7-deazaguanine synthase
MAKERIVILNSGGLNSAVITSMVAKDHVCAAMHVRFGHRAAEQEAELFDKQADFFEVKERLVVDMPHFSEIGGSARVNRKLTIEDALAMDTHESPMHVAGLIGSLVFAAYNWAHHLGATRILVGVCDTLGPPGPRTATVFPDYSREFMHLANHLASTASTARSISVDAPLIDLSRAEIIKLGHRLKSPFELTWSCISSGNEPCGGCIGCVTRQRGFLDAALADPILLQTAGAV